MFEENMGDMECRAGQDTTTFWQGEDMGETTCDKF